MKQTELKYYFVYSKSDDYGACKLNLVQTTSKNANEYYEHKQVDEKDLDVLKKYFDVITYEDESSLSNDERFYGQE